MEMQEPASILGRLDPAFQRELDEIKDKRIEKGIDKVRKSNRALTAILLRHSSWAKIKEDAITYDF